MGDVKAPEFHLVVHDDDSHTFEYVIDAFVAELGVDKDRAVELAREINETGLVRLPMEDLAAAQRCQEKLVSKGRDARLTRSRASMMISIECSTNGSSETMSCCRMTANGLERLTPEDVSRIQAECEEEATAGVEWNAENPTSFRGAAFLILGAIVFFAVCALLVALNRGH